VRRLVAAALVVAALLGPGCGRSDASLRAAVGKVAPSFKTHDLDGTPIALTDYRGNIVFLNFWASWCVPCRREFPLLAQFANRPGVVVLGVVYNDTTANARKFVADHGGTWPALKDDGQIAKAYRVGPGIPATIVIGPGGVVLKRKFGEIRALHELLPNPG
jgi:thiol-disulfide isomerase/thioredoxin